MEQVELALDGSTSDVVLPRLTPTQYNSADTLASITPPLGDSADDDILPSMQELVLYDLAEIGALDSCIAGSESLRALVRFLANVSTTEGTLAASSQYLAGYRWGYQRLLSHPECGRDAQIGAGSKAGRCERGARQS